LFLQRSADALPERLTFLGPPAESSERPKRAQPRGAVMEFLSSWYTMGGMFVALLVLIGLMIFLRNNKKDEE
jgi:hypothetical protein